MTDTTKNFDASFFIGTLNLLCQGNKTGILTANSKGEDVFICIKEGSVVYVSGSSKNSRLGFLLESEGLITKAQLNECLRLSQKKRQSLGKSLIENNYIPINVLKSMVSKQAELVIFNMFLWDKGSFEYKDTRLRLKGMVITNINIIKLLLEATRILNKISMFKSLIKSDNVIFKTRQETLENRELLKRKEKKIYALIDGRRTVKELIDESGFFKITVYSILYSLFSSGLIAVVKQ